MPEQFERVQPGLEQLQRAQPGAEQFQRVQPGDLITAELMNRILAFLEGLDRRVSALEAGTPVVITEVVPPRGGYDQEVHVRGRNLGFSTRTHRVFVEFEEVTNFDPRSNDEGLIFRIPQTRPLPPPWPARRIVPIYVMNRNSTAVTGFLLEP